MSDETSNGTRELHFSRAPQSWKLRAICGSRERFQALHVGQELVVGSGEAADWTLEDASISGLHCSLSARADGLFVRDLGSRNGTFVGAGRVSEALLVGERVAFSVGRTTLEATSRRLRAPEQKWGLVGESEAVCAVREKIQLFAPFSKPVLILGESGTGKDVVARALHDISARQGRYVAMNMAAMPDSLLDAELFGHERGAFTGAVQRRAGLFEQAASGTLFLDEIADLSPAGQAKLLRIVEDKRVRALGTEGERLVDVRVVAATCAPLEERVAAERFRHDLFHRLSTLTIELPALRHRRDDIPILARHYLSTITAEVGSKLLTPGAQAVLQEHDWPGNVRELFAVLYRAAVHSSGRELSVGCLQARPSGSRSRRLLPERARELLDVHGSVSAAARAAGVPRSTFRSVLERQRLRQLERLPRGRE